MSRAALLITLGLTVCTAVAIQSGATAIGWTDWIGWLNPEGPSSTQAAVLWQIRLPRIALALLAGAALGLSGALTQGLFRNPLADPGLLGVTSGAACAAALSLIIATRLNLPFPEDMRPGLLPMSALAGALTVAFMLDRFARWFGSGSIAALLLCGIALNALTGATIGLCTYLADDAQLRSLSFWMLGSLAGSGWPWIAALALLLACAARQIAALGRALNVLALGEMQAHHCGLSVRRLRSRLVVWIAALCGITVAWCGMIGFIGLIAPHAVRLCIGADHRRVLPLSMGTGALLLLAADTLARSIAVPAEIPVGIFTALLGAPFFLLLLRNSRHCIG